jgi:hypothetical protein
LIGLFVNPHTSDDSCDETFIAGNVNYKNGSGGSAGERPGISLLSSSNCLYDIYVYNNLLFGNQTAGIKKEEDL